MSTIAIKDISTIRSLEFDLPDGEGGVVVLRGRNAAGKSTALQVVRALVSGQGRLATRDGREKGTASGFGATINVRATNRRIGEADVPSLEGRLDFSDLVRPDGKTRETRDKVRIRALLGLTAAVADPALFYDLAGGRETFDRVVDAELVESAEDLVELAGRVNRAFHAAAKQAESAAQVAQGKAAGLREALESLGPVGDAVDEPAARAELEAAARAQESLASQAAAARKALEERRLCAVRLADIPAPDMTTLEARALEAAVEAGAVAEEVDGLRRHLAVIERVLAEKRAAETVAKKNLEIGAAQAANRDVWSDRLDKALAVPPAPSQEAIAAAESRSAAARKALADAAMAREAAERRKRLADEMAASAEQAAIAEDLRERARSTDCVLSAALPPGRLRSEGGLLVCDTIRGEGVPYDDCSDGERWSIALPYGIQAVGAGGVIPVSQDCWQDLDAPNREMVATMASHAKVWLITAEVADGDLRAERWEGSVE